MKVLLVYPQYPETFWSFKYALKFIGKKASFPPLGLFTVASLLPSNWEKRLVDLNVSDLKKEHILWADYVFISAISVQERSAKEVIKRIKAFGKPIVAGGPLFTSRYHEFDGIDYFVLNEGEITIPLFINDLRNGNLKNVYTTDEWADLTRSPAPSYDLIDFNDYAAMCIQYSRGCPFECDFCEITTLFGRKPRTKEVEQIINELEMIYSLGWRGGVFFVDDNFISNKKHLKEQILPAIIEWQKAKHYPFAFITQVSINLADDDKLIKLMVDANFLNLFIGIESPNYESLEECSKNQNKNRDLIDSVKKIQSYGFDVMAGFIVGFDNDPPNIFDRLIDFIEKSNIVTAMVGILNAPVKTKLFKKLSAQGRILKYMTGDNTDFSTNIIPKMDMECLVAGYERIVKTIYKPENLYNRIMRFLKDYKPSNPKLFHYKSEYFLAFIKSLFVLGLWNKGRFYYWKLLSWSILKKPRLLAIAVTFAIYGYHFRKIFEKHSERKKTSY